MDAEKLQQAGEMPDETFTSFMLLGMLREADETLSAVLRHGSDVVLDAVNRLARDGSFEGTALMVAHMSMMATAARGRLELANAVMGFWKWSAENTGQPLTLATSPESILCAHLGFNTENATGEEIAEFLTRVFVADPKEAQPTQARGHTVKLPTSGIQVIGATEAVH